MPDIEMSTANWITIVGAVVGIAVTWGAMQAKLSAVLEKLGELKNQLAEMRASRDRTGERLGRIENELALQRFALNEVRTRRRTLLPARKNTPSPLQPVDGEEAP